MATRRLSLVLDLDSGQFSTRITDATGKIKTLSSTADGASGKVDKLGHSTRETGDAVESLNKAVWKLQLTLYSVTFIFGGFTAGLVKVNAEAQKSIALLEGLSKKTEQAGRKADAASDFQYLREFAKNAPYSLDTLTNVFVKLRSAGIDPTTGALKALVDGVASFGGNNDILERATIAIQQMAGKGTVSMEELRQQLGEAMPTALKIMSRAAGKSVPEFVNEVSKGNVMWRDVQDKFFVELESASKGASERLMNTLGGQTSRIKTNLQSLMLAIGGFDAQSGAFAKGGFMDTLTQGARDLNTWLTDPRTLSGAAELGHNLAELLVVTKEFFQFLVAHAGELKLFAEFFVVSQSASLAKKAIEGLAASMLAVRTVQQSQIKEALSAKMAQLSAAAGTYKAQEAALAKAEAVLSANRAEVGAIDTNIQALREEAAAYETNIALASKAKAEALAQAAAAVAAAKAGLGGVVVGAGSSSRTPQSRAVEAENTILLNRQQLAKVTTELTEAEALLATRGAVLVESEAAVAAATTATGLAARGAALGMGALTAVVDLLGGPWIAGILGAGAALAFLSKKVHEHTEFWDGTYDAVARANAVMRDTDKYVLQTKEALDELNGSNDAAEKGMEILAGKAGTLARKLNEAAMAAKTLAVNNAMFAASELGVEADKAQAKLGSPLNIFTTFKQRQAQRDQVKNLRDSQAELQKRAQELIAQDTSKFLSPAEKKRLEDEYKEEHAPPYKKPKKGHISDAQRMAAKIDDLAGSAPAINDLIDTMDEGSKAADEMRAKIKGMRDEGRKISPEQEAQAIAAANANARLSKAYDGIKSIIEGVTTETVAAKDAGDSLGDSYNTTAAAAEKYNRKLDAQLAQILKLDPALANDAARMKKLNDMVEQSKAAYLFTTVAEAARKLGEEMAHISDHALDPDFARWDAFRDQITKINEQLAEARKLPDDYKTEDGKGKGDVIASLNDSRAKFSQRYVDQIESDTDKEIRTITEGLMTVDAAREVAYQRELKRIDSLTSTANMNEEERAKYGVQMANLAERMKAAAAAQYARDTETSGQKMAREWADFTGNMKQLDGKWMDDFRTQAENGTLTFKGMLSEILLDYLDTLAKARLAAVLQPGMDALTGFLTRVGGSILGAITGTPPTPSLGPPADLSGLVRVPGHHKGGIAGGTPTFFRMVSPALFEGAKRYHNGGIPGLKQNEVASILKDDEGVFTKEQMKALGAGSQKAPNVQVNVINEAGVPLDADQGKGRFDGNKFVVDVIVSELQQPGRLRNAVKSVK